MSNVMNDLGVRFAQQAREAAEHKAACTEDPCARCGRYRCRRGCGERVDIESSSCAACRAKLAAATWRACAMQRVPAAFLDAEFESEWLVNLLGSKVHAEAMKAVLDHEHRVAAVGPPGSGKTSLIAAMLLASDFSSYDTAPLRGPTWVSAHQLAKARALHPLGEGEAPLIRQALEAPLLVVDELGGEDQRYASAVAEVLYERHAQDHPTWVTTGVSPKEIADRYGGGIARRVFEDAKVFRLVGRSR